MTSKNPSLPLKGEEGDFWLGEFFEDGEQLLCFFRRRGPARRQADDGVILVIRLPEAVGDFFGERFELVIGHDDENLVGRGLEEEAIAVLLQGPANRAGCLDGGGADLLVEAVREQRVKLQAEQPAFGEQGAVLLHDREEMRRAVLFGEDDGLAEESAAFRAADVEGIAAGGDEWQAHVVFGAGERVG